MEGDPSPVSLCELRQRGHKMIQIKTSVLAMNDRGAAGMGPTPGQKLLTACVLPLSALHKGLVVFIIYGITLLQLDIN
jgi:hypothetical protein